MKNVIFLLVAAVALFTISCNKSEPFDPSSVERVIDMRVPSGFLYETSKDIQFKITVSDDSFGSVAHRITLFDGDPANGGTILAIGAGSVSRPFTGRIDLEILTQDVYVEKKSPSGEAVVRKATISGNTIEMDFASLKDERVVVRTVSVDCSDCDNILSGNNQNHTINNGVTCITGNFSGNININGNGELRICGNATIQNLNMWSNNSTLTISETGSLTVSNNFSGQGSIQNYGSLTFNQGLTLNANGNFINDNTISVGQDLTLNGNADSENYGLINVGRNLIINGNGTLYNECSIVTERDGNFNGKAENYGYMSFGQQLTLNGGANTRLELHNAAMVTCRNILVNKPIRGNGSMSLVKVNQNTTINGSGGLQGNLQFCDANGIETNWGQIATSVSLDCDLYIPSGSCNPEGNGTSPVDDSDGDNVPDPIDDFPDDSGSAFGTFYPSAGEMNTLVFEDLWPGRGDYDMNDMVMDYRYGLVVNGENGVTRIQAEFILRAAGASSPAGFGVEFPFLRSNVASVNGAELEAGHTNAVVVVFENSKEHLKSFNTQPGNSTGDPVPFTVEIVLNNPVPLNQLGLGVYNPFIWMVESPSGRGHEIHLPGKQPTALADVSIFGTGSDNTNLSSGNYYLSQENLPWGLTIPMEFAYPIEKVDICVAYVNFANWAQSGGTINQNWYLAIPGNVNLQNIYD